MPRPNVEQTEVLKSSALAIANAFGLGLPAILGLTLIDLFTRSSGVPKRAGQTADEFLAQIDAELAAAKREAHEQSERVDDLLGRGGSP